MILQYGFTSCTGPINTRESYNASYGGINVQWVNRSTASRTQSRCLNRPFVIVHNVHNVHWRSRRACLHTLTCFSSTRHNLEAHTTTMHHILNPLFPLFAFLIAEAIRNVKLPSSGMEWKRELFAAYLTPVSASIGTRNGHFQVHPKPRLQRATVLNTAGLHVVSLEVG